MSVLYFQAPPLPHFIIGGKKQFSPNRSQPVRNNIGIFKLLIVTKGYVWIKEEERELRAEKDHALLIRPDREYVAVEACPEVTECYWLHFQTSGEWSDTASYGEYKPSSSYPPHTLIRLPIRHFSLKLPLLSRLLSPEATYQKAERLLKQEQLADSHAQWRTQLLFQDILATICGSGIPADVTPPASLAKRTAEYIRVHFQERITYARLQKDLHYHPNHIARCMEVEYGCTPLEYLIVYRMEQAKQLLIGTELSIHDIAERTGFERLSYFSRLFSRQVGMSPSEFRKLLQ